MDMARFSGSFVGVCRRELIRVLAQLLRYNVTYERQKDNGKLMMWFPFLPWLSSQCGWKHGLNSLLGTERPTQPAHKGPAKVLRPYLNPICRLSFQQSGIV